MAAALRVLAALACLALVAADEVCGATSEEELLDRAAETVADLQLLQVKTILEPAPVIGGDGDELRADVQMIQACEDIPGWNYYGVDCSEWANRCSHYPTGLQKLFMSPYAAGGYDPTTACCGCGGGRSPSQVAPIEEITVVPLNPSGWCSFDGNYVLATNDHSCRLGRTDGSPVVIDYTKASYTKYTFNAIFVGSDPAVTNFNICPHAGFKVCDLDSKSDDGRGGSPEMWFIDRWNDYGYGLYNGGWGHVSRYPHPGFYGAALPTSGVPKAWEVTMYWNGSSYLIENWVVEGSAMPEYKGFVSGCGSNPEHFTPKVWNYCNDWFGISNFTVQQANSLDGLTELA